MMIKLSEMKKRENLKCIDYRIKNVSFVDVKIGCFICIKMFRISQKFKY